MIKLILGIGLMLLSAVDVVGYRTAAHSPVDYRGAFQLAANCKPKGATCLSDPECCSNDCDYSGRCCGGAMPSAGCCC